MTFFPMPCRFSALVDRLPRDTRPTLDRLSVDRTRHSGEARPTVDLAELSRCGAVPVCAGACVMARRYRSLASPNGLETGRGHMAFHTHMPVAHPLNGEACVRRRRDEGQSLAEFSLILPLFMVMLMGLIEFSLAFNANLGVNQASQNGALLASQAGNSIGADCLILERIERDVTAPADRARIREVQIQRTNPSGSVMLGRNRYDRGGSTSCLLIDGRTITVPYQRVEQSYAEAQRCNVIAGCPMMVPPRSTVDTVGVQIEYRYAWMTPLGSLLPFIGGEGPSGPGYTFQKRNVFRLEPVL